ncbi:unnamed protein product, partial [Cuscuta europaea]
MRPGEHHVDHLWKTEELRDLKLRCITFPKFTNNDGERHPRVVQLLRALCDHTTYARLCERIMQEMSREGLYDMRTIHGKFLTYNSEGIYVASMLWPIHDDQSWIYFLQFARNQYERLEIYINAEKKQMVDSSQQRTSRRPPNQGTSRSIIDINVSHDASDSDDDPYYNALSFSEHESSSEDSDDNPNENEDEDEDEEEFVEPTYCDERPIYVSRVYDTFQELKEDVSLQNLKEFRTFIMAFINP